MRAPSAADLLDAWERARTEPPALRAAFLLSAASDREPPDSIASVSIGEIDRRLLTLREWTFGPTLAGISDCASCGDRVEWTVQVAEVRAPVAAGTPAELSIDIDRCRIRFRLPNSRDLLAASGARDRTRARHVLLARCLLGIEGEEQSPGVHEGEDLPEPWSDAVCARMAEADPQADSALDLTCLACGHRWNEAFDIGAFFWAELSAWAERILHEVHTLACAYGWRERDIVNMSPWRRQFYLGLVGV